MPFLAVELDAVNLAPDLGRAGGVTEESAGFGLIRMWAWCFRSEQDQVTAAQLSGFFGGDPARIGPALVAFGFAEARADGWRVRGAHRYLRLQEARRRGGLAAKKHLRPGGRKTSAEAQGAAEVQPSTTIGLTSALTPNTEHRTPRDSPSENPRAAPTDDFTLEEQRQKRTRKSSRQQVLYTALVAHRAEVLGPDALPDEPWTVARQNETLGGQILDCEPGLLLAALQRFLESDFAGRCNPPGPLGVFVKQWSRWVSDVMRSNAGGVK